VLDWSDSYILDPQLFLFYSIAITSPSFSASMEIFRFWRLCYFVTTLPSRDRSRSLRCRFFLLSNIRISSLFYDLLFTQRGR
jgi:hypothetical protein